MSLQINWTECPDLPLQLSPVQQNMVHVVGLGMAIVGVRQILSKDLLDTATRFKIAQDVGGAFAKTADGKAQPVTIEHLKLCVGLKANVKGVPRQTFLAQVFRAVMQDLEYAERQQKEAAVQVNRPKH